MSFGTLHEWTSQWDLITNREKLKHFLDTKLRYTNKSNNSDESWYMNIDEL